MSVDEVIAQGERLRRANEGSPDVTSALAVGAALAMALYHRQRTGKGQYLETTMVMSKLLHVLRRLHPLRGQTGAP